MPKAYAITSDPFYVNGNVTETAADTFTQTQISLPLDSLNREGIIVHAAYFTGSDPDRVPNASSFLDFQVTSTSKTGVVGANDANLIAKQQRVTTGGAAEFSGPHLIEFVAQDGPYRSEDVLAIVATDDVFLAIKGLNQTGVSSVEVRLVCSRIRLEASAYAALVTNELSS